VTGFLLDENLPAWWPAAILAAQPQLRLWIIGDGIAPSKQTLDPAILTWCEANDAALLTNNRRSMPGHLADHVAAGGHVPGIFLVDPQVSLPVLATSLAFVAGASLVDQHVDQLTFLPLILP
jgi:Domain of unknown function (DUF5615)